MRPLPIVLCCVLLATLTTALKQCDDCVRTRECASALQIIRTDRSPAAIQQLKNAVCGDGKVCCSDFLTNRLLNDGSETTVDEIENHRNIRLLPTECGDIEGDRITGGTSAGLYEFPWLALISYREGTSLAFKCGGSVINEKYVLTAAHCIEGQNIAGVRIGDYDINQKEDCVGEDEIRECESKYQDIAVTHRILRSRNVSVRNVTNDIGLLRLARPVDFSYRNSGTICLPIMKSLREMKIENEIGVVAGWGATEDSQQSNILLKVKVSIYSKTTCSFFYRKYSKRDSLQDTICAGETGHDSCKGDSGGPLMIEAPYNGPFKYVQFGIVSFGLEQCGHNIPGIYTDVRKYMKWILDTIKP